MGDHLPLIHIFTSPKPKTITTKLKPQPIGHVSNSKQPLALHISFRPFKFQSSKPKSTEQLAVSSPSQQTKHLASTSHLAKERNILYKTVCDRHTSLPRGDCAKELILTEHLAEDQASFLLLSFSPFNCQRSYPPLPGAKESKEGTSKSPETPFMIFRKTHRVKRRKEIASGTTSFMMGSSRLGTQEVALLYASHHK